MADKLQAIRGMNDILPEDSLWWKRIENAFDALARSHGYAEIRTPIVENTALFKRSIGEVTDIVEKEMYTFTDLNGDSLSLRPEGTASVVRACIEHGLSHNQQQKLFYAGPMFRHEKPQKGRYRQFYQFGIEALGFEGVSIELEQLLFCSRFWQKLDIDSHVNLQVNTIGTIEERNHFKTELIAYFEDNKHHLDEDSQRRLHRNPLRILDSKNEAMAEVIDAAPKLMDFLKLESSDHFQQLCSGLDSLGIRYQVNPRLVRGLDYYGQTVFEWVTTQLGSQATVCAGGRYDALFEQLGGRTTPAVGFSIGCERLLMLMKITESKLLQQQAVPLAMFLCDSQQSRLKAIQLADQIRQHHPDVIVLVNHVASGFKSQFKKADKSGARYAFILGESELTNNQIGIKDLRQEGDQIQLDCGLLMDWCEQQLKN